MLLDGIRQAWWTLGLRGLVAILFGIAAFAWPGLTLAVLITLFGAFMLVNGVFGVVAGVRMGSWFFGLNGVIGIIAGLLTFFWPGVTATALVVIIGVWAIMAGVVEIMGAIQLRKVIDNELLLGISGLLSVIFGIVLVVQPAVGALSLVWIIGSYAMVIGILLIMLAFRLRGSNQPISGQMA
jgi:uncharacterized membrane protein HdeD (DUF308 family)